MQIIYRLSFTLSGPLPWKTPWSFAKEDFSWCCSCRSALILFSTFPSTLCPLFPLISRSGSPHTHALFGRRRDSSSFHLIFFLLRLHTRHLIRAYYFTRYYYLFFTVALNIAHYPGILCCTTGSCCSCRWGCCCSWWYSLTPGLLIE